MKATRIGLVACSLLFLLGSVEVDASLRIILFASIDSRDPTHLRDAVRVALAVASAACLAGAVLAKPAADLWRRMLEGLCALDVTRFWCAIAVLGIGIRLLAAALIDYQPIADAWWLHDAAASLSRGEGFAVAGVPTATRPPGYSFVLAGFLTLFGHGRAAVLALGILSGAAVVAFGHSIANRLYGARAARVSAVLLAFYPALVLMAIQSLSDLFFLALLLGAVWFVVSREYSLRAACALGVLLGFGLLSRGMAIGLFAVLPLLWFARHRNPGWLARSIIVTGVVTVLVASPWALRNERLFGRVTLETNIGTNLYWGNHPGALSGARPREWPSFTYDERLNEAEHDAALFRHARAYILANPREVLGLMPGKLWGLYALETEVVTSLLQAPRYRQSKAKYALYAVSQLAYMAVLLALLARAMQALRARERPTREQWAGPILCAYFTLLCLVFHGEDRYRLPILPWMLFQVAVLASASRVQPARIAGSTEPSSLA